MRRILLSSAFLALATVASAQTPVGPGWSALAGCWVPVPADSRLVTTSTDPRVCVVPSGTNGADLVTIVADKETERTRIEADGQRRDVSKQGCSGWEKAEFSSDGRRLFLTGEQTCAGGLKRTTSGVFALATNGDWINASGVTADSSNSVRVSRYAPAGASAIPAEMKAGFDARAMSDRTARVAAQREVSTAAVIEASRFLGAPTVEAWLAELEQDFELDEKALIRLADEGVSPSVIDVMVAVSNPRVFSVRATGNGVTTEQSDSLIAERRSRYRDCYAPVLDPWAWYAYDPCDPYHRYSHYRSRYYRYGYNDYYGRGWYSPYYDYGPYGRPVVIVVNGTGTAARPHGRMTKDGYKGGSTPSGSGSSTSRGSDNATTSRGTTGSSSSGSGESGRTATRKPPTDDTPKATQAERPASTSSTSSGSTSSGSGETGSGRVATRKPPTA